MRNQVINIIFFSHYLLSYLRNKIISDSRFNILITQVSDLNKSEPYERDYIHEKMLKSLGFQFDVDFNRIYYKIDSTYSTRIQNIKVKSLNDLLSYFVEIGVDKVKDIPCYEFGKPSLYSDGTECEMIDSDIDYVGMDPFSKKEFIEYCKLNLSDYVEYSFSDRKWKIRDNWKIIERDLKMSIVMC